MTLDEEETLKNLIQETDIFVCVKDKNKKNKKQNKWEPQCKGMHLYTAGEPGILSLGAFNVTGFNLI